MLGDTAFVQIGRKYPQNRRTLCRGLEAFEGQGKGRHSVALRSDSRLEWFQVRAQGSNNTHICATVQYYWQFPRGMYTSAQRIDHQLGYRDQDASHACCNASINVRHLFGATLTLIANTKDL